MTFATGTSRDFASFDRRRPTYGLSVQGLGGATVLGAVVVIGAWMLATQPFAEWDSNPVPPPAAKPQVAQARPAGPALKGPTTVDATVHLNSAMLDPTYTAGLAALAVARHAPLDPQFKSALPDAPAPAVEAERVVPVPPPAQTLADAVEGVPLPTPRPADLDARVDRVPDRPLGRSFSPSGRLAAAPAQPPDNRNMFEKLFGLSSQPSGPVLAYAAPESSALPGTGNPRMVPGPVVSVDKLTAVYDISAHTVYMPDGSTLEAHSGLGNRLDDPNHVNERDRGATPPHVYDLEPRAQIFHGVKALRLNPVGGGGVFGRAGLLAHSFMLGPNGDSNGCVSFRNYNAFLQAYESGAVRRLVVVARRS